MSDVMEAAVADQNGEVESGMSTLEMAKLIRDSAGDALSAIPGIEEIVIDLTKILRSKILAFVMEDVEFVFSGMRMFDGVPEEQEESFLKIRVSGDENSRVAAVLAEADPVRHILAILFGGQKASIKDFGEGALRPSEASLFLLLTDELVTGLVEAVDIISTHGVPGAPIVSTKKEFRLFQENCELVALEFGLGFEKDLTTFEFLVPLEVFDLLKLAKTEHVAQEQDLSEEDIWASMLNGHVDGIRVPMAVELSAMDISLSRLGEMQLGETIFVNATKGGLRVLDDTGATAFVAALEISDQKFGLRVVNSKKGIWEEEEA